MNRAQCSKTLGVLGGLGPMSGIYFCELLTSHTLANKDQDHINIMLSSRADTPDRTSFILGTSDKNPVHVMMSEVNKLIGAGADVIAIPCNTAHYFYDTISAAASVPVINIIKQTALFCKRSGMTRIGLLSTEGTVRSKSYEDICALAGIECIVPDEKDRNVISDMIYNDIKAGRTPDMDRFLSIVDSLERGGCESVILGCTELSLLKKMGALDNTMCIDSLEVLAYSAIRLCGKTPTGFDDKLMSFKL